MCLKALENMTSTTPERHRRSQTSKPRRPFTDRCVIVYGDERAPHTRMFPDLAGETVTDQVLWTPARLRACAPEHTRQTRSNLSGFPA